MMYTERTALRGIRRKNSKKNKHGCGLRLSRCLFYYEPLAQLVRETGA